MNNVSPEKTIIFNAKKYWFMAAEYTNGCLFFIFEVIYKELKLGKKIKFKWHWALTSSYCAISLASTSAKTDEGKGHDHSASGEEAASIRSSFAQARSASSEGFGSLHTNASVTWKKIFLLCIVISGFFFSFYPCSPASYFSLSLVLRCFFLCFFHCFFLLSFSFLYYFSSYHVRWFLIHGSLGSCINFYHLRRCCIFLFFLILTLYTFFLTYFYFFQLILFWHLTLLVCAFLIQILHMNRNVKSCTNRVFLN